MKKDTTRQTFFMDTKAYAQITQFFARHERGKFFLLSLNKILTGIGFVAYPALLFYLFLSGSGRLPSYILVPALAFAGVTAFRKVLNRPRPYEMLPITPLIKKEKCGQSFPSRHVFSMFLIAVLWCFVAHKVGILLLLVGSFLAAVRVVGGVHFLKDVLAGAVLGSLAGVLTEIVFWLSM